MTAVARALQAGGAIAMMLAGWSAVQGRGDAMIGWITLSLLGLPLAHLAQSGHVPRGAGGFLVRMSTWLAAAVIAGLLVAWVLAGLPPHP